MTEASLTTPGRVRSKVLSSSQISSTAFELRLERGRFDFTPGHEIEIYSPETESRIYSIASGRDDPFVDILYRLIPGGQMSPWLSRLEQDALVEHSLPFGSFLLRDPSKPIVFVATGTGVAPCLSFLRTYPELELTLLHGVRHEEDLFHSDLFEGKRYYPCISREDGPGYRGRVTSLLPSISLQHSAHYYLCGANDMISDARAILLEQGIAHDAIFSEAYYFWRGL